MTEGFFEAVMAGARERMKRISRSLETLYRSDWYLGDARAGNMEGAKRSLNLAFTFH